MGYGTLAASDVFASSFAVMTDQSESLSELNDEVGDGISLLYNWER
jgi:hypothetical protein